MASNDLTKEEVKRLVYAYKDNDVTEELYSFGLMLLDETSQRSGQTETKAAITLGWATAIAAFLFATLKPNEGTANLLVTSLSGVCALTAIVLSFLALRIRGDWKWPSDLDWFEETALNKADELKRFHIRSIHEVRQSHNHIVERKSDYLSWGQRSLLLSGILMLVGIALKILSALNPLVIFAFLQCIGMRINPT